MAKKKRTKARTPREKLARLRSQLRDVLKERDDVIDGVLSALVSGEHVFLGGPPGTAKTMLAEMVNNAIDGAEYFYWLLTRFSTPEELFGPHSLAGMKADEFTRVLSGKLPEAHVAFLDECFKANSAILNALLTLINERRFHNGVQTIDCPLTMMIGASNELPQGAELEALFDRFMLRYWIPYISDRDALKDMLSTPTNNPSAKLDLEELEELQLDATDIDFSDAMLDLILDVKDALEKEGFIASDRRWKKAIAVMRGYAFVVGDVEVNEDHFSVLADMLWREPKDRPALLKTIMQLANPIGAKATEYLDAAKQLFRQIPLNKKREEIEDLNAATTAIIDANTVFTESIAKLRALTKDRKSAQVEDTIKQIRSMHKQCSRYAAKLQGLSL